MEFVIVLLFNTETYGAETFLMRETILCGKLSEGQISK
jgi:hypothetical protein